MLHKMLQSVVQGQKCVMHKIFCRLISIFVAYNGAYNAAGHTKVIVDFQKKVKPEKKNLKR